MLIVTPNFHFSGHCRQDIELYKKAFGAQVAELLYNSDADPRDYVNQDPSRKDLVYHAEIYIGRQRIMMTDSPVGASPGGNLLSLVVTFETAEDVKSAYAVMADGAEIIRSMTRTTYSSCFVSLIDKFGMRWEWMTEQAEE